MHTKGKWIIERHEEWSKWFGNITIVLDEKVRGMNCIRTVACLCKNGTDEENEANAKRIVQCVNTHDDLLKACKAARTILKNLGYVNGEGDLMDTLDKVIKEAE